ncbi:Two-component response regulator-like [Dionaea muscipula]
MHNNRTSDPRSPSHLENGLDGKSELVHNNIQSHSGSNSPTQFSSGGNFYKDMTTTSYGGFGFNEPLVLRNMSTGSPSAFQSVKDDLLSPNQKSISMLENAGEEPKTQVHHQFPLRSMKPQPFPSPQSVSSNIAPVEGDVGNSLNGSASGSSNHGTDRQNGCSTAANAGGLYNESVNGRDKSGSGDASGTGSGNPVDQRKHAQREAALTKFREKRKERCFKGKVRYQSRKRLAEQRPRVRGQFARPPPSDTHLMAYASRSGFYVVNWTLLYFG